LVTRAGVTRADPCFRSQVKAVIAAEGGTSLLGFGIRPARRS